MDKYLLELSQTLEKMGYKKADKEVKAQWFGQQQYKPGPSLREVIPSKPTEQPVAMPSEAELVDRIERLEMSSKDVQQYLKLKAQLAQLRK